MCTANARNTLSRGVGETSRAQNGPLERCAFDEILVCLVLPLVVGPYRVVYSLRCFNVSSSLSNPIAHTTISVIDIGPGAWHSHNAVEGPR